MVKRQKEKQYLSAREQREQSSLRSARNPDGSLSSSQQQQQRRLPFSHCALTLLPYQNPVCNENGIVFENSALLPFLLKHKCDPTTGKPMTTRDVILLHMDRQDDDDNNNNNDNSSLNHPPWQCPILQKTLTDHTKIVAIRQRPDDNTDRSPQQQQQHANVYSYEAYRELCVKPKNYVDLISGKPFDKKRDVLVLFDPEGDDAWNKQRDINHFYHIRHGRALESASDKKNNSSNVRHSMTASRILQQLAKKKDDKDKKSAAMKISTASSSSNDKDTDQKRRPGKILAQDVTGVAYTSTAGTASFTSTGMDLAAVQQREATGEEILKAELNVLQGLKQKGLVRLETNLGNILLELHCDLCPRTCYNFMRLAAAGKYNGTVFHRLIPNFMIQGGSSNSIQGGKQQPKQPDESFWGNVPFRDEFHGRLKHDRGGVLSMANAGPNTNRRQFFITLKQCPHLDRKHTVFGSVVQGMDVLEKMARVPTHKKTDRPVSDITIEKIHILKNPVQTARGMEEQRLDEVIAAREEKQRQASTGTTASKKVAPTAAKKATKEKDDDVGRYLREKLKASSSSSGSSNKNPKKRRLGDAEDDSTATMAPSRLPQAPKKTSFGDFSGW